MENVYLFTSIWIDIIRKFDVDIEKTYALEEI